MTFAALRTALDSMLPHIDPNTEVTVCIQHTLAFSTVASIDGIIVSAVADAKHTTLQILTAPYEPSNIHRRQQS